MLAEHICDVEIGTPVSLEAEVSDHFIRAITLQKAPITGMAEKMSLLLLF